MNAIHTRAMKHPTPNQLRIFEVCGRLGSFTKAAEELLITPSAVSHQMKMMEESLKAQLFTRSNRNVSLTAVGQEFWLVVHGAANAVKSETDRIFGLANRPLKILCARSFLRHWLMPKLTDFYTRYPKIKIEFATFDKVDDIRPASFDIVIRLGDGRWRGYKSDWLADINLFPIASPKYLASHPPIHTPADLKDHTLIRMTGRPHEWERWLHAAGVKEIDFRNDIGLEGETLEYQAALSGLGIALARDVFSEGDIAEGRIVRLFDICTTVESAYYLVYQQALLQDKRFSAFRKWMLMSSFK